MIVPMSLVRLVWLPPTAVCVFIVREMSKKVIELLKDNEMIREEREKSRKLRDKYVGLGSGSGGYGGSGYSGGGGGGYSGGGGGYSGGGGGGGTSSRYGGEVRCRGERRGAEADGGSRREEDEVESRV